MLTRFVKNLFRACGMDIHRYYPERPLQLLALLRQYQVDMIFDIGANEGQSVKYLRAMGYAGSIVSYEPVKEVFAKLAVLAAGYEKVHVVNKALGKQCGVQTIQVSGGGAVASSLLKMTQNVYEHAPAQRVVREEAVQVSTLADEMRQYYPHGDRCFLKIDVQGYENNVLAGAGADLARVVGIKLEMSLVPNYETEVLAHEMLPKLYGMGFRLAGIEPGWRNEQSGEIYQVDGLFFRTAVLDHNP